MLTQEQFIAKMQLTPEQMEEVGLIVKPCNGFHTDATKLICDGWQLEILKPESD